MTNNSQKSGFVNPFRVHSLLMHSILGKIVNDTFFGLACLIFGALAIWVFARGSFFDGFCICLTVIFGLAFYIITIFRVAGKDQSKPGWKAVWLVTVILLPIMGGLLYYYLRLLIEYLPSRYKDRLRRMVGGSPRHEALRAPGENTPENSFSESDNSVNFTGLDLNLDGAGPV